MNRMRATYRSVTWSAACAIALLGSTACTHTVQLRFPESTPGDAYVCETVERSEEKCHLATTIDRAANNPAGTVFVILPKECHGQFNQITIHDAGSSSPTSHVICSPLENDPPSQ